MNLRLLALSLVMTASLNIYSVHAVQTRHCPNQIVINEIRAGWFAENEIRKSPFHRYFNDKMIADSLTSVDFIKTFAMSELEGTYQLNTRHKGVCLYHSTALWEPQSSSDHKNAHKNNVTKPKRAIQLYTKNGADYFRVNYSFKQKSRASESFAIETKLLAYALQSIQIDTDAKLKSYTTIEHDCFDRTCATDAWIGEINLVATTK